MVSDGELRKLANELTLKHWGIEATCPIEFVNRDWKSCYAYFTANGETGDHKIVMSRKVNARRTYDEIYLTLLHELTHWYMWREGKPHRDDDEEFVRELLRVGASISGTKSAQKAFKQVWKELAK